MKTLLVGLLLTAGCFAQSQTFNQGSVHGTIDTIRYTNGDVKGYYVAVGTSNEDTDAFMVSIRFTRPGRNGVGTRSEIVSRIRSSVLGGVFFLTRQSTLVSINVRELSSSNEEEIPAVALMSDLPSR